MFGGANGGKSMRRNWKVVLTAVAVAVVALAAVGLAPASAQSSSDKPRASEVGVTATELHVATVADVDTPLAPGLFEGAKYGALGAARYLNSKAGGGGIAGRKVVVDFLDSKLNANDSRNSVITACQDDFAMVGNAMVFLTSADDIVGCVDKAGATTGLPDMPSFTAGVVESCAPTTYGLNPPQLHCDTATKQPQQYTSSKAGAPYFVEKFGTRKLHGAMLFGNDTKDAERGSRALLDSFLSTGIEADQYKGFSATTTQSGYTGVVAEMKADKSNIVNNLTSSPELLRAEMQLQGMNLDDVVYQCGCYGEKYRTNPVLDGVYIWGYTLPIEEASSNAMLKTFLKYVPRDKADGFAQFAWSSMLAFADAANAVVEKDGVNGLTRTNFLKHGVTTLTKFDAGGMMGAVNIAGHVPTDCSMLLQLKDEKYVRLSPKKKGTFDCTPSNLATIKADYIGG
jgi:hypothetical protein